MNCASGKSAKKAEMVEFIKAPNDVDNGSSCGQGGPNTGVKDAEDYVDNKENSIPEILASDITIKGDVANFTIGREGDALTEHNDVFCKFVDRVTIKDSICVSNVDNNEEHNTPITEQLLLHYLKRNDVKHLKVFLRGSGWKESHAIRQRLWRNLCMYLHKADEHDIYMEYADDIFAKGGDTNENVRLPGFVDMDHLYSYHLTPEGIRHAKRILCVLEHSCPDIVFSPLLFSMVSLLHHYMDTSQCYNCIYALLRHKDGTFLSTTKVSFEASKLVIIDLAKKYAKAGYVNLVRNCGNIESVFETWIWWIFEDLPFFYLVRVVDCYLLEGVKIFYRVVLAILILYTKFNGRSSSSNTGNILKSLRDFCRKMPVKATKLLKTAFGIRGLSRKEIRSLQVKHEMYINSIKRMPDNDPQTGNRLSMSRSFNGPVILQNIGSNTLTVDLLYTIWNWLPSRCTVCQPELLYTSEEHGTSLVTLYQRVEHYQPTIIVIKTTRDEIVGAFCSTYWRERRQIGQNLSYFGTGETFVFTLHPEKKKYEWVGLTQNNIPNTANMFQAGDRSILTIGGGHGEAISLDENLLHCRSEKCDTFNNKPLTMQEDFQCKVVEVYGFQ